MTKHIMYKGLLLTVLSLSNAVAGTTYIGGLNNSWNTNSNGSICSPSTGLTNTTPSVYTCSIALNGGGYAIVSINADILTNLPDTTALSNAISQIESNSIALGSNTSTYAAGDVALGGNSSTTATSSIAPTTLANKTYNHAGNNPTNAVSVGDAGKERVIQSVAAGQVSADSTDAVNGSQLYAAYDAINNIYQRQMAGYDAEISQINQNISDLKEGAYAGIAGALAIGNLPQPSAPGKNMISGGMGTYKGHSAAAFGFSSLSENEKIIWKMGASFDSNKNSGGAVSFGYQW
jgi:trimeric autotransporter adhesin